MYPSLTHGAISWSELMSSDPAGAADFYEAVFGWETRKMPIQDGEYRLQMSGGKPVAGIMTLPHQPMESAWAYYVTVDDVDASFRTAVRLGARGGYDPMDVPTVGRMAGLFDPQGAFFNVVRWLPMPEGADSSMPPFEAGFTTPGAFSWFHLHMVDMEQAVGFYKELFAWEIRVDQMSGGPYNTVMAGGAGIGGIIPVATPESPSVWSGFVTVSNVDAAQAAARAAGGRIAVPTWDIPGVGRIARIADPTGASLWIAEYVPMS